MGIIGFIGLFLLIALRMPIGAAMAFIGFAGLWFLSGDVVAFTKLSVVPFQVSMDYSLAVLPLFVLMAHIIFATGMGHDIFNLAQKWFGFLPGGIAQASVVGSAIFASISASSIATATTIGRVAIPEMKRLNYDPAIATGAIAAGGTMGVLIPPSGAFIIYGMLTETSIGKLFAAGIIPGILEALFYMAVIYIMTSTWPHLGPPAEKTPFREKIKAFVNCGEVVILSILLLAGIVIGWFTPTEAGAIGAFGAIIFSSIRRKLTFEILKTAIIDTLKISGMIYTILIGAFIFNYFLAPTNIPYALAEFVKGLPFSPLEILLAILVVYLILGCFLDVAAMTVLTIPIFFPMITSLGFNPIWFGVIFVRMAEIAMITPPIGMNVFVVSGIVKDMGIPMETVFKGILPFLIADFCHVALLISVPWLSLFLPGLMLR